MKTFIQFIFGLILLVAVVWGISLVNINWGTISTMPTNTIVVSGEAKSNEENQIASFTAGVDSVNDEKEKAISEVNTKIDALIKAVKDFGIADTDIQTQNISVYQGEEMYYAESGSQKSRPGQWRVNNSINIKLRQVDRASELATLLTNSGATNVYGPNFAMEDTKDVQNQLLSAAIADAHKKAELMIEGTGRKLGKVISINEGGTSSGTYPIAYKAEGYGGGGTSLESGSTDVYANVTVVFELK